MSDNDSATNNSQAPDNYFSLIPIEERRKIWDRLCQPVDKPGLVTPLTDFDRTFQNIVGPKLVPLAHAEANILSLDLQTFSEAHARVMAEARRLGATHLSEGALLALDDWIAKTILDHFDPTALDGQISIEHLIEITRQGGPR